MHPVPVACMARGQLEDWWHFHTAWVAVPPQENSPCGFFCNPGKLFVLHGVRWLLPLKVGYRILVELHNQQACSSVFAWGGEPLKLKSIALLLIPCLSLQILMIVLADCTKKFLSTQQWTLTRRATRVDLSRWCFCVFTQSVRGRGDQKAWIVT